MFEFLVGVALVVMFIFLMDARSRVKLLEKKLKEQRKEAPIVQIKEQIDIDSAETSAKVNTNIQSEATTELQEALKTNVTESKSIASGDVVEKASDIKIKPKKKIQFGQGLLSVESIISKLGILLLIIGIGFVYKIAYDRGFITNGVVVITGYIIGLTLFVLGQITYKKTRVVLSQVLFGGGIATHFIVTFAAYQQYRLIHSYVAFVILVIVAIVSLMYALNYNSRVIGAVGILGSLYIPFFVGLDFLGLYGVGLYLFVIAVSGMTLYYFKQWRTIQLSTIIGVECVTFILAQGIDKSDEVPFVVLVLLLLLIFISMSYFLYYKNAIKAKNASVTYGLIITLPILALLQIQGLSLGNNQWIVIFAILLSIYIVGYIILVIVRGFSIVADILLSYISLYSVIVSVLMFDGDVSHILISFLGIMFYFLGNRQKHNVTRIIGHVVFGVGIFVGYIKVIEVVVEGYYGVAEITTMLTMMGLMVLGSIHNKGLARMLIGTICLLPYSLISILSVTGELASSENIYVTWTIILGLLLWAYIWLSNRFMLMNRVVLGVVAFLPLLVQLFYGLFVSFYSEINTLELVATIFYGINLYIVGGKLYKNVSQIWLSLYKVIGYLVVGVAVLTQLEAITALFNLSMSIYGLLLLVAVKYEKDIQEKIISGSLKAMQIGLILMAFVYAVVNIGKSDFDMTVLLLDVLLLGVVYLTVNKLAFGMVISALIRILLYMLLVYQNLNMVNSGIVTLVWALYAVGFLFYHIKNNNKTLIKIYLAKIVYIAIKLIIIDLATIDIIWKVITSITFGVLLLVLSYFIQPILKDNNEINDEGM